MTRVYASLATLIDRLDSHRLAQTGVIHWGCPIPAFGDLSEACVGTLGLNPSGREFVDESGKELQGRDRRFHTLNSLGLSSWSDVDARHLNLILDASCSYFQWNPYDAWFKKLDVVVAGANASFYDPLRKACHLDLIPYATMRKWAELSSDQRSSLLSAAGNTLGLLLRDSPLRTLILNGSSVVQLFQTMAGVRLERGEMPAWSLPRQSGGIAGIAYWGVIDALFDVHFDHELLVLGFNHNLQSSFGVTNEVVTAIGAWVAEVSRERTP